MSEFGIGSVLGLIKDPIKGLLKFIRRKRGFDLSPDFETQEKWRDKLLAIPISYLGTRGECIVVDSKHYTIYSRSVALGGPTSAERTHFKSEIMSVQQGWVEIWLGWVYVSYSQRAGWQPSEISDPNAIDLLVVGHVPYKTIQHIDLLGNSSYDIPHIYAPFSFSKNPYDEMSFYRISEHLPGEKFERLVRVEGLSICDWPHIKKGYTP